MATRKNLNKSFRQGDVLLVPIAARATEWRIAPAPAAANRMNSKGVILAFGEVTGHAHVLANPSASLMVGQAWVTDPQTGRREVQETEVLRVPEASDLVHEEHATLNIPAGTYEVRHQREFDPAALRQSRAVLD